MDQRGNEEGEKRGVDAGRVIGMEVEE